MLFESGIFVWDDLVVVVLEDENWYCDGFEVFGLVGFGECFDVFVVGESVVGYVLVLLVGDYGFGEFCIIMVEVVEWI